MHLHIDGERKVLWWRGGASDSGMNFECVCEAWHYFKGERERPRKRYVNTQNLHALEE